MNAFDIIIIGAGHAGCEAALASARMGTSALLMTISLDTVGQLSCNPAIGGLAKGQLVKEIDALGGEMGRITDRAAIQFRELNSSKGPAVRSPRAQVDRRLYPQLMKYSLEQTENLTLRQGTAAEIKQDGAGFIVKTTDDIEYSGRAVIVTAGTFMNGLIHIGEFQEEAGRAGEFSSLDLSPSLAALGFKLGRLKTGTPPRINGRTLDYSKLVKQEGDPEIKSFSAYTEFAPYDQLPCWITYTNQKTHEIISDNFERSPLFSGQIQGTGPRYCPSVELKVKRFPHHDRHQVFLEPEGRDTNEFYCNGLPTSVPIDVQEDFMHTIAGLEQVEIVRYGYAIEYDFIFPHQIKRTMETKKIPNLFFAGQVNGTSGYEEAAAQGLLAGINAVLNLRGEASFELKRYEAYIGVLADDLVTKDIQEPYRMFTSLAEYRLKLRQDNADLRLADYGHQFGLVTDEQHARVEEIRSQMTAAVEYCTERQIEGKSLASIICRPENDLSDLEAMDTGLRNMNISGRVREQVEIELKYAGYYERQQRKIDQYEKREGVKIPEDIDFLSIKEIKLEAREKLQKLKPATLEQAARIAGVSPADISVLMVYLHSQGITHGS